MSGNTTATLNFYAPPPDGAAPFNHVDPPPPGLPVRNYTTDSRPVPITDIRGSESSFQNLDRDAFALFSGEPPSAETAFTDDDSIRKNYYPELEALLLKTIPGANKVIFFDHTIRRASKNSPREPVQRVHIDQTARSAALRVRRHAASDDEADRLLAGRHRIINVWRPLNRGPVASFPLAFASSASLRDDEVVPVEHRYANGYTGETAGIRYHEGQKWYYLSGMTGDQRLLLECFDSEALKEGSGVQGGRVAHTAFAHPGTAEDAEGRESIEVRALVFGP
ncbi:conserved hypothetical protein [Verticillium alfalfae VaMs.102]|uniref:7alpha-cephem-methoxylase P8 chain related protein n=1 Tax=Verticillium alfalfae (strain VaMs.102 / ATCC MYA-4576 / FGSC 10136) TaxID=526221 RepID=C9SKC5_VERA1|nr:conserved hypothetical protein [Verticillium alfalfae VaMs.102]EEY19143.1 conserved hypothetical protein [Verticillium alfalfae VaMs.102]